MGDCSSNAPAPIGRHRARAVSPYGWLMTDYGWLAD